MTLPGDLRAHLRDPLYRNAYALMLNTAVTGALGFAWYLVAARTYTEGEVGFYGAIVAAMQLLSAITQLNFASVLIRFLPKSGRHAGKLIGSAYVIAVISAILVTTVVLLVARLVAPDDHALHMSFAFGLAFVAATAAYSIFNLQDAAMIGLRRTIWVPLENAVFGVAKIALVVAFATALGAAGIFASWVVPLVVVLVPVNYFVFRNFVRDHGERSRNGPNEAIDSKKVARFIAGDFPGSIFAQASTTLLPLLVFSALGGQANGHFVIAQSIAMFLDLMLINLAASFTVEAAHAEDKIAHYARAILKHMARIVVPVVGIIVLAAPTLLSLFGDGYSENATDLLRLLAVASLPRMFTSVYGGISRLEHKTYRIAIVTGVQATLLVVGSIVLMPMIGVEGVGVAALAAQCIVTIAIAPKLAASLRTNDGARSTRPSQER